MMNESAATTIDDPDDDERYRDDDPADTELEGPVGCRLVDRVAATAFDDVVILLLMAGLVVVVRDSGMHFAVGTVLAVLLVPTYFALFEGTFSTSPGKYFWGLKVVSLDGGRCSYRQAWIRSMTWLIEANPFLLGTLPAVISVLRTDRRQRIGDLLAGTVVANTNDVLS